MPAPKNPNTIAATAATIRKAQDRKATALRQLGWLVIPSDMPADAVMTEVEHFLKGRES